jgi:hypothetical protein
LLHALPISPFLMSLYSIQNVCGVYTDKYLRQAVAFDRLLHSSQAWGMSFSRCTWRICSLQQ